MQIELTPNGNLKLTLDRGESAKIDYLRDIGHDEVSILESLLESYSTNGSYTYINPSMHFACCLDEIGIVDEYTTNEDGEFVLHGELYVFTAGWCTDITEELQKGSVILSHITD